MSRRFSKWVYATLVLGALVGLGSLSASAAQLGDASQGRTFARQTCASCHAVEATMLASPVAEAPPFRKIANTPGINRLALRVFFRTPHRTMPNLVISGDEADDVIAYILSLKRSK